MKKTAFLTILVAVAINISAQFNMYVWQDGVKITYPVLDVDSITFGEGPAIEPFVSLISVEDNSVADWRKVPSQYIASASCAAGAKWTALKNVKVYADKEYINILIEYDPLQITSTDWVPFHVYLNADHSTATGGSVGQWIDTDIEILMEAAIIENGEHVSYNPGVFEYRGTIGAHEWAWQPVSVQDSIIGRSQKIGNRFEIQLSRTSLPIKWDEIGFTIGFDIQQSWNSVGVLPNNNSGTNSGKSNMLYVEIDWEENTNVEPEQGNSQKIVSYRETLEIFPNPERGFLKQIYYTSQQLNQVQSADKVQQNREKENITLYLDNYFMMDYINSDISQTFLTRMENNFKALREGGGKAVIRYSYKYDESTSAKPWDATKEVMLRHIAQLKPYWQEYADVILCLEAGFIGVWGEWYYTDNFQNMEDRWDVVDKLLEALPADRQLALRTPGYKMKYLKYLKQEVKPLTAEEAYKNTAKARLCGHNDCFVSSSNDVGTYANDEEREFWAEDTKYTLMGGETCAECGTISSGANAIKEMAKYHWSYINDGYHEDVLNSWKSDGSMTEIQRRLGYRFVLEEGVFSDQSNTYTAELTIRNVGFAALANPRDVELIFVSKIDASEKYVYRQDIDPRFWMPGETHIVELTAQLDEDMLGEYEVYLNLPDPYASLHDNPAFSIRLANENIWEESTGYNYLTDIAL